MSGFPHVEAVVNLDWSVFLEYVPEFRYVALAFGYRDSGEFPTEDCRISDLSPYQESRFPTPTLLLLRRDSCHSYNQAPHC